MQTQPIQTSKQNHLNPTLRTLYALGQASLCALTLWAAVGCKPHSPQTEGIVLKEGWAKATVAGQQASAAYITIESSQAVRLLGGSTPKAQAVEMHEMKMEGEVMKMRSLEFLDIAANSPVELAPGSNHLMLLGLKDPLQAGTTLPLTLRFATQTGQTQELSTTLNVRSPAEAGHDPHAGHEHKGHTH